MNSFQWHDKTLLFQPTVKAITTVLGLPSSIWLLDKTEKVLQIIAAAELIDEYIHNVYLSLDETCVAAEVFRTRETIIVKDIESDKRWKYKAEALEMGWESAVVAPLWLKRKIGGILDVYVPKDMTFNFDEKMPIIECFANQISATLRQVQGLETLNEVAGLISVVKEHDSDLFERILQSVQKVLNCKHVSIFLVNKDGDLMLEASSTPEIKRTRFKPGEGLAGYVFQTGKSLLVSDVRQYPQFVPGLSTDIEERSMLLSPILFQSKRIGVISADMDGLNKFDEYDQKLMETLRSQIVIAIHNVRLFQSEREQREEAERLRKIERIINSNIDLEQVVGAVLDELHKVVEHDKASVQLIRGDHRFIIGARGFSIKDSSPRLIRNVIDDPLIRKIVQSQQVLVLSDVSNEPLWEQIPETSSVHSWIGAPLVVGDQVIGLLTIDHPKTGYYTQKDGENVAVFANQVSAAIYRSDFFQLMRDQAQALTELNKLTYRLLSIEKTHDIRELLQKIAESAKDVLRADVIELYEYRQSQNKYNLPPISVGEKYNLSLPQKVYKDDAVFNLIHQKEALYAENSQTESILSSPYTTELKERPPERFIIREKIRSTAVIPLRAGNESMGLMFASYRTPQNFTKEQCELVELFARQAAIAIKNIRLYEELSKERRLLRTLIDASPDHIYLKDRESRFLIANETVVRSMRVTKMEELIGKIDFDFHPKERADQYYADEQEIFKSGKPMINREEPNREPDTDAPIWLLTTKVPLYDNQNNIIGIVGINRDITERKQAEKVQASLYSISEAAHTSQNLEKLFPTIHKIIGELMPARNFYIALYDSETGILRFPYYVNEKPIEKPSPQKLGTGLTEHVLRTGEPFLVSPEKFKELSKGNEIKLSGGKAVYWLGIPLKIHEKTIGVFAVQSYAGEITYGASEQNILMFVSTQIATAIERVHAHDQIERRTEELKESEQRLSDIINFLPDATFVIDKEGKVIAWNHAIEVMTGVKAENILGRGNYEYTLPLYGKRRRILIDLVFKRDEGFEKKHYDRLDIQGDALAAENYLPHLKIHVYGKASPLYDSRGNITGAILTIRDITDRKRAEEELEKYREQLEELVKERTKYAGDIIESSLDMIIAVDLERRIVEFNKAAQKTFGYGPEEILGKHVNILYADKAEALAVSRETDEKGHCVREIFNKRKNGKRFPCLLSASILRDAQGNPLGIMGISRDITERKRAEQKIKTLIDVGQKLTSNIQLSEDEILQLIYNNASQLMDTTNMYIAVYDEALKTVRFGLVYENGSQVDVSTSKKWKTRGVNEGGKAEWIINHRGPLLLKTHSEAEAWYEKSGQKHYGAQIEPSWMGVPMISGNKVLGVIAVYQKTREYAYNEDEMRILLSIANQAAIAIKNTRLYLELKQVNEELKELERRKSEFLSTISHELRTPLTPIKSFIENMASFIFYLTIRLQISLK